MKSVGIFGASGYAGLELAWLLAHHDGVEVKFLTSERFVGRPCEELHPGLPPAWRFVATDEGAKSPCDVVFLATPPDVSRELLPKLSCRVVDLSNTLRFTHEAAYGLFPYFAASGRVVANPGCYATAAILALAPLFAAKLVTAEVVVDASSGTSGAGRRASEDYSLSELHDDLFAYKVMSHPHSREIAQALSQVGGEVVDVTFTPKLLPLRRGILSSAYARLKPGVAPGRAHAALAAAYANDPFVTILQTAEQVRLRKVVGTNAVRLHMAIDHETGRVLVLTALDNLLKGAAGQALENMNLLCGFPRERGLTSLKVCS
jgi:N-acetyl-gamma-glutamyl-phosphate reductase